MKIGVVVTGSIAAYKACDVVSRLVQAGHEVRVVVTRSSLQFVGTSTFEGLTGKRVFSELFAAGDALEHIELTRWADLMLVCPATANTLNRFAAGLADDLPGALFLARPPEKPFLAAPAMNPNMWAHPATQAAVAKLREWGVGFIAPGSGRAACDEYGEGRMAEPDEIVAAVDAALAHPAQRLRVLITSGGTAEPIDAVRVLTNTSTGRTGARIAEYFQRAGHEVVLLRARTAAPARGVREQLFSSFDDLARGLEALLGQESFDAVIHAAAVGDFGVAAATVGGLPIVPGEGKLESGSAPVIVLRTHPKLLDQMRSLSRNPKLKVVGFKLTAGATPEQTRLVAAALLKRSGSDVVVGNDASANADGESFPAELVGPGGRVHAACRTRGELAVALEHFLLGTPSTSLSALGATRST